MGFFGGKTKTTVGTTVSRVIPDNVFTSSIDSGSIKALFDKGDIGDYIMEDMVHGVGLRAERMFTDAKKNYTHGLPSGTFLTANNGIEEVTAILASLENNAPITIEYCNFGAPNSFHMGWLQLVDFYGYNPTTNKLGTLSASLGKEVYLTDIQVNIPIGDIDKYEPGTLVQWGLPATHGYNPKIANSYTAAKGKLKKDTPVNAHISVTEPFLLVSHCYQQGSSFVYGSFKIPLAVYDDNADYYQASYYVGGVLKYWAYKANTGSYSTLDAVFNSPPEVNGTFFPFVYFRYNKVSTNENKTTPAYLTSKKMVKYLNMDYDEVADNINANPDIADVIQAMMIMAVPANTKNQLEQRYLYDFFDNVYGATAGQATSMPQLNLSFNDADLPGVRRAIEIKDKLFKMNLNMGELLKKIKTGVIGPIGSYTSSVENYTYSYEHTDNTSGDSATGLTTTKTKTLKAHIYRKQISRNVYVEITVRNLRMMYFVEGLHYTTGDELDDILLVPIDRSVSRTYSIVAREELYTRSLHYVFNSLVVTKIKWYQTGFFQFVMIIVAIVITVITQGAALQAFLGAIAAGTITVAAALLTILTNIALYLITGLVVKLFVKAVGIKFALILAIVAAVAGVYIQQISGGLPNAPWAMELLQSSTGLITDAVKSILQDQMSDLLTEAKDFELFTKEQDKLLDSANDLLQNTSRLSPFVIFGESPDAYFSRTIHTGNIGTQGFDIIHNFVDTSLQLPTLSDTADLSALY